MGKRTFYCTIILTVGSLAWTMYSLPDQIEAVQAAKPGSHVRHASGTAPKSNAFGSIPDVDALLDFARNGTAQDEELLSLYTPDPDISAQEHRALLEQSRRHAHVRDR